MFTNRQIAIQKSQKKKQHKDNQIAILLASNPTMPASMDSGSFCTADQCFLNSHSSTQTLPMSSISQSIDAIPTSATLLDQQSFSTSDQSVQHEEMIFNNSTLEYKSIDEVSDHYVLDIIPADLYRMMKEAAQQGLLASFLLTLSNELTTEYFKARHYQPEQIYWINQIIRGLALIAIGASPEITIAVPIVNYFLTEYIKINKVKASYLTTGMVLTVGMLTSPIGFVETSLMMAAGIGTHLVGSQITKYAFGLIQNSIFSTKKRDFSSDDDLEERWPRGTFPATTALPVQKHLSH